jgi:hypothetical protein
MMDRTWTQLSAASLRVGHILEGAPEKGHEATPLDGGDTAEPLIDNIFII